MENMNVGYLIGLLAFSIGIVALLATVILQLSAQRSPGQYLRYLYYAGVPILLLTSTAGLWECYKSGDWTKCLVPLGLLCLAINALVVSRRSANRMSNEDSTGDI